MNTLRPSSLPISARILRQFFSNRRLTPILGLSLLAGLPNAHAATMAAQWSFDDIANATSSVSSVGGVPGAFNGVATRTAGGGGVSGAASDYGFDVGGTNGAMLVNDAGAIGALNAITGSQAMSISYWQFLDATPNSTAFWSTSPSSSGSLRGLSAHSPWSDGNMYWDSGGCCALPERISGILGATVGTWEFMAFVYDNGTKTVYRGNTVVATAGAAAPLKTDLTNLIVGNDAGMAASGMDAKLDNFTVWLGALTPAEIAVLAVKPVPEPTAALLGILGLVGAAMRRRRSGT